jgi:hypothetical protein
MDIRKGVWIKFIGKDEGKGRKASKRKKSKNEGE